MPADIGAAAAATTTGESAHGGAAAAASPQPTAPPPRAPRVRRAGRRRAAASAPCAPGWRRAASPLLAGCATEEHFPLRGGDTPPRPADSRALIAAALPPGTADRAGWAVDIHAALSALKIAPSAEHVCAVIAVAEQESTLRADPVVPGLAKIAWDEIDRRAERIGVPRLVVRAALMLPSRDGKSYGERIDAARTEQDLSRIFDDIIDAVPLGRRLFGDLNPVRTGGPMQVGVAFAERHAAARPYPYPVAGSIRDEVFTRRGGIYFGTAHLLGYPAPYDRLLYRFADFNAGQYASRNAAFQNAVSLASGIPLALDGDLVRPGAAQAPGSTEAAVRVLGERIGLGDAAIRSALERGEGADFDRTPLYERVYALAEQIERRPLPRAMVPKISLQSPKFTRKLTTEWFAGRVDERHGRCMTRLAARQTGA